MELSINVKKGMVRVLASTATAFMLYKIARTFDVHRNRHKKSKPKKMYEKYVVKPIDSVIDLISFDSKNYPTQIYRSRDRKIISNSDASSTIPDFLICHDFKDNYRNDKCTFKDNAEPLEFYIPQEVLDSKLITEFCYFSHHFITIPPTSWTNLLHRYGIKVYGTIITEWDEGKLNLENMLESKELSIKKLEEIRSTFNFDGWLVNIENEVNQKYIHKLQHFVQELCFTTKANCEGKVIWYDSVINTGELAWQDKLCEKNQCFYNVSDGIFLNYFWNDEKLKISREAACNNQQNVYVGIDCHEPRNEKNKLNKWPKGGFECGFVWQKLKNVCDKFSVAVFAPGWIQENYVPRNNLKDFKAVHKKIVQFWNQFGVEIQPVVPETVPTSLDEIRTNNTSFEVKNFEVSKIGDKFTEIKWFEQDQNCLVKVKIYGLNNDENYIYTDKHFVHLSQQVKKIQIYDCDMNLLNTLNL